jgi:cold shock CspA family protein
MSTQHATRNTSYVGIIISFNNNTGKGGGYGFIRWDGGADMFVHISKVTGAKEAERAALYPGDQVSFEIGRNHKGQPCAVDVRVQLRAEQTEVHHQPRHD